MTHEANTEKFQHLGESAYVLFLERRGAGAIPVRLVPDDVDESSEEEADSLGQSGRQKLNARFCRTQ